MIIEEICLGHVAPKNSRCKDCTIDGYNRRCEDYEEILIRHIEVEERDNVRYGKRNQ